MDLKSKEREIRAKLEDVASNLRNTIIECEHKIEIATQEKMTAAEQGDLRENSAYHIAVDKLAHLNTRLVDLDNKRTAWGEFKLLKSSSEYVSEGSAVSLRRLDTDETFKFILVPKELGDASIGAVSVTSPVGRSILGGTVGKEVIVRSSVARIIYVIDEII